MAQKGPRKKHIPQRTCVGCRQVLAKRALIRLVRTPQGVLVDATGKTAGRGAYLHNLRSCWDKGLKGALSQALKIELTVEDRSSLRQFADALPAEAEAAPDAPVPSDDLQQTPPGGGR